MVLPYFYIRYYSSNFVGTYTFKTTESDIVDYLEAAENKSQVIKDAIKLKKMHDLNPIKQEIPKLTNVRVRQ